jgi:preprotein translocase subunit SecA
MIKDLLARLDEEVDDENGSSRARSSASAARDRWAAIIRRVLGWLTSEELSELTVVELDQGVELLYSRYVSRLEAVPEVTASVIDWERQLLLDIIDMLWPQYLNDLERVEEGIWMRSYAQVDPFVEFRKEAAIMFGQLMRDIELNALRAWLSVDIEAGDDEEPVSLPDDALRFEAGGVENPPTLTSSTRESSTELLNRGIPSPAQRRTRRR